MFPALVAVSVVVVTVLYFLLRGFAGEKKKKLPVTLQDPTAKYPLCLLNKQVKRSSMNNHIEHTVIIGVGKCTQYSYLKVKVELEVIQTSYLM